MPSRRICCCVGCCQTFTVVCSGTAVDGATVTIKSGSTTITSGTTNSSGVVTLCVPAGTYTVTASGSTCKFTSFALALTCGEAHTLQCCPTLCSGCGGFPTTLFVTDTPGTITCTLVTGTVGEYVGCATLGVAESIDGGDVDHPCDLIPDPTPTAGVMSIFYHVTLALGSKCTLSLERVWLCCSNDSGSGDPWNYYLKEAGECAVCAADPEPTCFPAGVDDDGSLTGDPCIEYPVTLTMTLMGTCANGLPSPCGSSVTIDV